MNGKIVNISNAYDDGTVVKYNSELIKIKEQIPRIKQYDCQNVDFSDKHFVYFDITTTGVVLTIWHY